MENGVTITTTKKGNCGYNKNYSSKPHYNSRPQENRSGKKWEQKEKDSKITLPQESSHFVPTKFSDLFFRQFDLVMRLKRDELKNKGKVETQVSKITRGEVVEAFGITREQQKSSPKTRTQKNWGTCQHD